MKEVYNNYYFRSLNPLEKISVVVLLIVILLLTCNRFSPSFHSLLNAFIYYKHTFSVLILSLVTIFLLRPGTHLRGLF